MSISTLCIYSATTSATATNLPLHHTRRVSLTIVLVLMSRRPASTGTRPPLAHHGGYSST